MTNAPIRPLLLIVGFALLLQAGCNDSDDDDTVIVDPGPSPGPSPGPTPDPDPEPVPQPDPDPDPQPQPEPEPEPEPEPPPPPWVEQEAGNATFHSVSAIDADHAWALSHEYVIRTVDGGATWTQMGELSADFDRRLQFFDANHGYALTTRDVLFTHDGGATWSTRFVCPSNTEFSAMSFVTPTTGWVVTHANRVFRTTDGGSSWFSTQLPSGWPMSMKFATENVGYVAITAYPEYASTVLRTTDGGVTFEATWAEEEYGPHFFDISTVGATHAWFVGGTTILKTTDSGATWTESELTLVESFLKSVYFVDADNGWVVGDKLHHTEDGGATWTIQLIPEEDCFDMAFVSHSTGWVVGRDGLILKTTTGGHE